MKTEPGMAMSIGLLALVAVSVAAAQSPAAPGAQVLFSSGGQASFERQAQEEIVREIDDPHTGDRWLLMRNNQFPGGPFMPRVVSAGVPTRMPDGLSVRFDPMEWNSSFTVMPALPRASSASEPRMPFSNTSTSRR